METVYSYYSNVMLVIIYSISIRRNEFFGGLVERMDEYRTARRVLMAEVSVGQVRRTPRIGRMDG